MTSKFSLLFLFYISASSLWSQQLPIYNQYRNAQAFINPASVSSDFFLYEYNLNFNSSYRAQWISQEDTPRTLTAAGEYISNFGGAFELLAGVQMMKDQTGPIGLSGVYGRIGSLLTNDPYFGALGVGISVGYVRYAVNASSIIWKDPDDPNILLNDFSVSKPDLGIGIFYYKRLGSRYFSKDNIYVGLSVPQILGARYVVLDEAREGSIERVRHYYLSGGWYHFFNSDSFLELSSWVKYLPGNGFNADINARFQPGRTIWFGGGLNMNGIIHLESGVNIPEFFGEDTNLKIAYSFDYSLSAFGLELGSSHEVTLAVQLAAY
ncbi:MAG TPA: PorP/SprF family type IX secretion system membrane protein [Saprospiraceae bacterium]|nr:PorP/SprF family type IX secretion system membrane protein [Saprospiraceae bacterium]HMQ82987.1 PorP/SprF family type IX secretion system membrane protein [Saprospiraceae bacterium]